MFHVTEAPRHQQGFEWSRDGSRIAAAEPGRIRVVSLPKTTRRPTIPVDGRDAGVRPEVRGGDGFQVIYLVTDEPGDGP